MVPVTPVNGHVLRMLVEARHAEVLAMRMAGPHASPTPFLRPAYDLLNKLAGRPALLGE